MHCVRPDIGYNASVTGYFFSLVPVMTAAPSHSADRPADRVETLARVMDGLGGIGGNSSCRSLGSCAIAMLIGSRRSWGSSRRHFRRSSRYSWTKNTYAESGTMTMMSWSPSGLLGPTLPTVHSGVRVAWDRSRRVRHRHVAMSSRRRICRALGIARPDRRYGPSPP
jgi:hypothetical protein